MFTQLKSIPKSRLLEHCQPGGVFDEKTDDVEHMHSTLFDPGNLAQPCHSLNPDVHKCIRYLKGEKA